MRKIKILTLLALMLGSIVTTQAQEKQNDATWEETIGFIKKKLRLIKSSNSNGFEYFNHQITSTDFSYEETDGEISMKNSFPLNKLLSVIEFNNAKSKSWASAYSHLCLKIQLTGSYISVAKKSKIGYYEYTKNHMYIYVSDIEMARKNLQSF